MKNRTNDSYHDGIHCVGNGRAGCYIHGADIESLFAPCYSAPSALSLRVSAEIGTKSRRRKGTGIWETEILRDGQEIGLMCDFTHPEEPFFFRRFYLKEPLSFRMESQYRITGAHFRPDSMPEDCTAVLFRIPDGSPIFMACKTSYELFCFAFFSNGILLDGETVRFPAGESYFVFTGGDGGFNGMQSFENCLKNSEKISAMDIDAVEAQEIVRWKTLFDEMDDFTPLLKDHPFAEELADTLECVVVALKTQTSAEGGVLPTPVGRLAYGRDMYGVIRGYLAVGLYEEARKCITFFVNVWKEKGYLPNASGIGMNCAHCHENDDVEQTGYYLLELSDYVSQTGDTAFIQDKGPYISFLIQAQEKHLAGGMLPFNGDETYIAGGILPRDCMDHGSMEATALYITGTARILELAEKYRLLPAAEICESRKKVTESSRLFYKNFIVENRICTNQPARIKRIRKPLCRQGVCVGCNRKDWLRRTSDGGYLCIDCYGDGYHKAPESNTVHYLDCTVLMTGYVDSPFPGIKAARDLALAGFRKKSVHPSQGNTVGYEYGMWLYLLTGMENVDLEAVLRKLLELRTSCGVWSEFYRDGVSNPDSSPYRPWESAVNLTGIIKYLQHRARLLQQGSYAVQKNNDIR